jgi:hypothetical protein
MTEPRVPGDKGGDIELPCGATVAVGDLDMGLREFACECGETHAVVVDAHPLARFVPEFLVEVLRNTVETADEFDEFTTAHLMGIVREEFPDAVTSTDVSEDGTVGYSLVWIGQFDARRLHEVAVELVVELMDHAVSHAEDPEARREFDHWLAEFEVESFVDTYREERDFASEHDSAL